jgi:hypothetical protein
MLGVILLGAVAGQDDGSSLYIDEGDACRAKCTLFLAYVIAFGSIFLGTTLLLLDKQKGEDLWAAAVSVGVAWAWGGSTFGHMSDASAWAQPGMSCNGAGRQLTGSGKACHCNLCTRGA